MLEAKQEDTQQQLSRIQRLHQTAGNLNPFFENS
jgi:hypothetical protein